jgi:hypothetical protein
MNEDELRRSYAALRRERAQRPASERPSAETIRQALDGELSDTERETVLDQALASGASAELAMLQAAQGAARVASRVESPSTAPTTTRRWWPVAAAAALVLAVGVPIATRAPNDPDPLRFRSGANAATAQLMTPASGAVLAADQRFVWSAVPRATRYALELLDANGGTIAEMVTMDTTAALTASITEADRARITGWWVTATTLDGRRARSELRLTRAP